MSLSNIKIGNLKAPSFKVVNFKSPKVSFKGAKINTSIKPSSMRPAKIVVTTKGAGMP